jgi:hypothetical protein
MKEISKRTIKNEKKAERISITPTKREEVELIRTIQKAKIYNRSLEKPEGQPSNTSCLAQEHPRKAAAESESNDRGLPTLDLEQYEPNVKEELGVRDDVKGSTRYAWIGTGQCGGRLVKSFYDLGYKKVLVVNTTRRDLDSLDIPQSQKFLMHTNGRPAAQAGYFAPCAADIRDAS